MDYVGSCSLTGRGKVISTKPQRVARNLLREIGWEEEYPTNLELIARRLRVPIIDHDDLDGEGYLLRLPDETHEVLVKARARSDDGVLRHPRTRFTIAHEFGHFYLDQMVRRLEEGEASGFDVEDAPRQRVEQWCNTFARELLIPQPALLTYSGGPSGLRSAGSLTEAAESFGVSLDALVYQVARAFRQDVCLLSSLDPVVVTEFPRGIAAGSTAAEAVIAALTRQVENGEVARRVVAPVQVRTGDELTTIIGLVSR